MILTILSDADSVMSTMQAQDGALPAAPAGRVWLQMSAIGEEGTNRAMALAREHQLPFVDAPVLGPKQPAQEGKLVVLALAETIALAQGMKVDPRLLLEAMGGGPLDMPYLQMKGQAMVERSFEPSFALRLAAKDASLVQDSVEGHSLDLPVLGAIRARMQGGAREYGDQDLSATYLSSAPA